MKITRRQLRRLIINEMKGFAEAADKADSSRGKVTRRDLDRLFKNHPGGGLGPDYLGKLANALYNAKGTFSLINPLAIDDDEISVEIVVAMLYVKSANFKKASIRLARKFKLMYGRDLGDYLKSFLSTKDLDRKPETLDRSGWIPQLRTVDDAPTIQDMIDAFSGTGA